MSETPPPGADGHPARPTPDRPPAGHHPPAAAGADGHPAPPDDAASSRVRSTGIAAGVATIALAGGVVTANLLSSRGSTGGENDAAGGDPAIGGAAATGAPTDPSTDTPPAASEAGPTGGSAPPAASATDDPSAAPGAPPAIAGSWTGTFDGGGTPVNTRITFDAGDDPTAVTGLLHFADPATGDWARAGELTGTLDGSVLTATTNSQVSLTLTIADDRASGDGTLLSTDDPFPVAISLTRD